MITLSLIRICVVFASALRLALKLLAKSFEVKAA